MDDFKQREARYKAHFDQIAGEPPSPEVIEAGKELATVRREWLEQLRRRSEAIMERLEGGSAT